MKPLILLHYGLLAVAIVVHLLLCRPASYQSGRFPLDTMVEFGFPFLSILFVGFFAPFNRHVSSLHKWIRRIVFSIAFSIGVGGALQFRMMHHARPNHGPYLLDTLIIMGMMLPLTLVFVVCAERIICRPR